MLPIIPMPMKIEILESPLSFHLTSSVLINYSKPLVSVCQYLEQMLSHGILGEIKSHEYQNNDIKMGINLILDENLNELTPEGYILIIEKDRIQIRASGSNGIFYGIQTLRQILPPEFEADNPKVSWDLPCLKITDSPRFSYRGYMLDTGRFYLPIKFVKKVLDFMALLKLNRFHWHLTEDQGWRIEIKAYPKLTEIGSKRTSTPFSHNRSRTSNGIPHQGFYTQEEIKEVVAYAKSRFIEIIPEIEMPGHCMASLASYPELGCTGGPYTVSPIWGVKKDVFCPGKAFTQQFLTTVLEEIMDLFPYHQIHLGGDEVPKNRWKSCPDCQAKIKAEHLDDEHHLQIVFSNTMVEFLAQHQREAICWNEVTDDRLDKRTVVQFWRGSIDPILTFLERGGKTIISPSNKYYVNIAYFSRPLREVFDYEPVPDSISKKARGGILGIEAEMWGEVIDGEKKVEWCTFPRLFAIAQTAWTQKDVRAKIPYSKFLSDIELLHKRLEILGIDHAKPEEFAPNKWAHFKARFKPDFGYYAVRF